MHIGFVVNSIKTEQSNYTTIRLARRALDRGHRVSFINLDDFIYDPKGDVHALSVSLCNKKFEEDGDLVELLHADDCVKEQIDLSRMDVLLLRSDPADEIVNRPWAPTSGLLFAQIAAANGLLVFSDPWHLTHAQNKTYFQHFPESVRPRTCISRDAGVIRDFVASMGDSAVIKPLQGSGGQGVFVIRPDDKPNLSQMIEATTRDGFALVQEYLPEAAKGDLRLLLLNGKPLQVDGQYACFRRYNDSGDARSNISAGGSIEMAQPNEDALRLAETVGPKLIKDGMYLVGLDIVGDKLLEINVDTPGGINMAEDLTGVCFSDYILHDLERKVRLRGHYKGNLENSLLASI